MVSQVLHYDDIMLCVTPNEILFRCVQESLTFFKSYTWLNFEIQSIHFYLPRHLLHFQSNLDGGATFCPENLSKVKLKFVFCSWSQCFVLLLNIKSEMLKYPSWKLIMTNYQPYWVNKVNKCHKWSSLKSALFCWEIFFNPMKYFSSTKILVAVCAGYRIKYKTHSKINHDSKYYEHSALFV